MFTDHKSGRATRQLGLPYVASVCHRLFLVDATPSSEFYNMYKYNIYLPCPNVSHMKYFFCEE